MALRATRVAGALAVLAVGAVHLQQYLGSEYQSVPTIGPLFLLNAIGAGIVGLALLLSLERALPSRWQPGAVAALAGLGVAIAIGALAALFIAESSSLFGFSEHGYRAPIMVAILAEAATVLLLGPVAAASLRRARAGRRPRRSGTEWRSHPYGTPT
jgi:hypothetical protein